MMIIIKVEIFMCINCSEFSALHNSCVHKQKNTGTVFQKGGGGGGD